jgi:hypothetical protein
MAALTAAMAALVEASICASLFPPIGLALNAVSTSSSMSSGTP